MWIIIILILKSNFLHRVKSIGNVRLELHRLTECLRYCFHYRLNNDPGWKNICVILSDVNVPGECEHKIMDFIRRQRYNTHHVLCGADADLIIFGLATHEPNFTIIREVIRPNAARPCEIWPQFGHETRGCRDMARGKNKSSRTH